MTPLEYPTEAEARAALIALGLDETRYSFYLKAFGGWTWQALSALNRQHRGRYRTKRLAKKALKAHPGWTPEEKRMLRFYQYGRGEWSWNR